jgi:hypothetical protein
MIEKDRRFLYQSLFASRIFEIGITRQWEEDAQRIYLEEKTEARR